MFSVGVVAACHALGLSLGEGKVALIGRAVSFQFSCISLSCDNGENQPFMRGTDLYFQIVIKLSTSVHNYRK